MPTIQQLVRKGRQQMEYKSKSPALAAPSVVASAPVCTPPPRKNLTRQCVRLPVCVSPTRKRLTPTSPVKVITCRSTRS